MKHSPKRPRSFRRLVTASLALALGTAVVVHQQADAEPAAKVMLNGKMSGVFFNDGDSFRILKGPKKGAKARLFGFNTLESHGAVHQWGDWTFQELYNIAKMATYNGRKGTWTCTTDEKTDTYGRMLVFCEGLAEDQIRKGLAHAMSIDDNPGLPKLLEAQKDAIANKRGMWAHGVPEFVLTSLHSVEEDVEGRGTYNRVVSSADGHSIKWKHTNKYNECENVCIQVYPDDAQLLPAVLEKLKVEGAAFIGTMTDEQLLTMLGTFQRVRMVDRPAPKEHREDLKALLLTYAEQGLFGTGAATDGSCVVHVPFERRFGGTRAACLKK